MDPRLMLHDHAAINPSQAWSETQAAKADVLKCYEEAVQEPLVECNNIDSLYAGAQLEDSAVPEARLLREDFCSTAIVARTWLNLNEENSSQGVDIDLHALKDTQRRIHGEGLRSRERIGVKIVQSPAYAGTAPDGLGKELPEEALPESLEGNAEGEPSSDSAPARGSSWEPGAVSDRFERKFQARLAKMKKEKEKKQQLKGKAKAIDGQQAASTATQESSRLLLVHSDVLELPFSYACSSKSAADSIPIAAPDVIAALNYALCYFHSRSALLAYLRVCLRTLKKKTGVLICDLFAGPPTGEDYEDQDALWSEFEKEMGFIREGDRIRQRESGGDQGPLRRLAQKVLAASTKANAAEEDGPSGEVRLVPAPPEAHRGTCAEWPKGNLKLVRTGEASGGFEYWREDGPVDYRTNRFRMSLSFRFKDRSWLRDVFSYDFRIWSLAEILEAMEEVGFVRVRAHIVPRNIVDQQEVDTPDSRSRSSSIASESQGDEDGMLDMADLIKRTEREEAARRNYEVLEEGGKLFASCSVNTYIIACAP